MGFWFLLRRRPENAKSRLVRVFTILIFKLFCLANRIKNHRFASSHPDRSTYKSLQHNLCKMT